MSQLLHPPCPGGGPEQSDDPTQASLKVSIPFGARVSDLRIEATLGVDRALLMEDGRTLDVVDDRKGGFNSAALKYVEEYFRSVTGSSEFFNRHVRQELGWILCELVTNELYHGVLGFDSRDKFALRQSNQVLKGIYPEGTDTDLKRCELEERVLTKVESLKPSEAVQLVIQTGTDEEGRSFIEVSVGAPRSFDMQAAVQAAEDYMAEIDRLFEAKDFVEAEKRLEKTWGRGLLVMKEKLKNPGDSLGQEPPITGPVIARKCLPDL